MAQVIAALINSWDGCMAHLDDGVEHLLDRYDNHALTERDCLTNPFHQVARS